MYIIFISQGINYVIWMLTHLKDVSVLTSLDNAQTSFRFLYKKKQQSQKEKETKTKKGERIVVMIFTLNSLDLTYLCVPHSS